MADRRGAALSLLVAGRSVPRWWRGVAMTSPRSGRGGRPSLTLGDVASGRGGDRLAIVWTVKTSDGAEGEARNGRRWRRHPSPWFSLFLFRLLLCSSLPHHLKEEDEAGMMSDRRGAAMLLVAGRSAPMLWRCGGDDIAQKRTRWPPVPLPER